MKIPKVKDIIRFVREHPMTFAVLDWSKRTSLPGFFGVPIYDILYFLYIELQRNALQIRANSIAFSFMLAIFPATIFLFSLLPYFPLDGFVQYLEQDFLNFLPYDMHQEAMKFIKDVTETERTTLLSLGFIFSLFFASNGMMALLKGFNKDYVDSTFMSRNFIAERIVSLQLTLLLSSTLIASVSLIIVGNAFIYYMTEYIQADAFTRYSVMILRWFALIFLFYGSISVIYRYGPALKRKFNFFSPGATLATLLALISSWAFSSYVNQFGTYNQLYGSLGVLIVAMLWLQINAFILLVGFELNAAIAVNRDLKEMKLEEEK